MPVVKAESIADVESQSDRQTDRQKDRKTDRHRQVGMYLYSNLYVSTA